jgi:hypothetical protein
MRMFENRMLRIFGTERKELVGNWKRLNNGKFHNLYEIRDESGEA